MCEVMELRSLGPRVDASSKATVTSFTPTSSDRVGSDVSLRLIKVWLKAGLTLLESVVAVRFKDLANLLPSIVGARVMTSPFFARLGRTGLYKEEDFEKSSNRVDN